ncbi:hypothetical protein KSP39_PZI004617 [Platanthera zijinensis]|uniref:Uncharacterized protein n=1 Tax=Platanthera zijinensis TaxID=2320716 RepID=A0AAP0GCU9_9ASPA
MQCTEGCVKARREMLNVEILSLVLACLGRERKGREGETRLKLPKEEDEDLAQARSNPLEKNRPSAVITRAKPRPSAAANSDFAQARASRTEIYDVNWLQASASITLSSFPLPNLQAPLSRSGLKSDGPQKREQGRAQETRPQDAAAGSEVRRSSEARTRTSSRRPLAAAAGREIQREGGSYLYPPPWRVCDFPRNSHGMGEHPALVAYRARSTLIEYGLYRLTETRLPLAVITGLREALHDPFPGGGHGKTTLLCHLDLLLPE